MTDDWRSRAACRSMDPAEIDRIFYPEVKLGHNTDVRAARAICDTCPVREECLQYAIAAGEEWGIWAGLTTHQRRTIRMSRGLATQRTCALPSCGRSFQRPPGKKSRYCCPECAAIARAAGKERDRQRRAQDQRRRAS